MWYHKRQGTIIVETFSGGMRMVKITRTLAAPLLGILFILLFTGASAAADYAFPDTIVISASRTFQDTLMGPADIIVVTVNLSTETDYPV